MAYMEVVVVLETDNGDRQIMLQEVAEPRLGRIITAADAPGEALALGPAPRIGDEA